MTASDLTPELLAAGRLEAELRGARLRWVEADAEALPFADDAFDVVLSCVGAMFAPHHQAVADEMVRVSAPGAMIGMVNWTPAGFIGQLLAVVTPFAPPPPAGVQRPTLWGTPDHVATLLADRVSDLVTERRTVRVDRFRTPAQFRELFKVSYGPVLSIYRHLAADTGAVLALDAALEQLAQRHQDIDGAMEWEYLLVTARVS